MGKIKAPLLRRAHRGEEGITLIELLIVVAILGVIAAVIVLAVGPFAGKGHVEAANTELDTLRVNIATAMVDCSATGVVDEDPTLEIDPTTSDYTITLTGCPPSVGGTDGNITIKLNAPNDADGDGGAGAGVFGPYFSGTLKAKYSVNADGEVDNGVDVDWGGITWSGGRWIST